MVSVFLKPPMLTELLGRSTVVDLRRYPDYRSGHIPNAISIPFHYFISLRGLALYPPLGEDLSRLSTWLSSSKNPIILYDEGDCKSACRAAYTLEHLGIDARVLEGGFEGWRKNGFPVEVDGGHPTTHGSGQLNYVKKPIDKADMLKFLEEGKVLIVDTRHPEQYKAARIPSSINIPWYLIFTDDGALKDDWRRVIGTVVNSFGDTRVVTYCDEGMNSTLVMYALRMSGIKAECYLPSFNEWGSDPDLPKERG
jgi:thiosulfate/3-mercaptopyruvate sulfurtransferase